MAAYELLVMGDHRSLLEAAAAAAVQLNGMHAASVIAGCGRMCIVNAHSKVNDCLSATTMSDCSCCSTCLAFIFALVRCCLWVVVSLQKT